MKNAELPLTKDTSVLFATFSAWDKGKRLPTNGSVEPLRDFLLPRVKKVVLIDQLVPSSGTDYKIEIYTDHRKHPKLGRLPWWFSWLRPFLEMANKPGTQVIYKIRDFLSVVDWAVRDSKPFDFCIALESVNAIAGILLRKIGKVKRVVYYVSDYSPNRYPSRLFNAIYLWLDRFAAMHSDYIWDVSLAMHPARIKAGLDGKKSAPVIHVGNGIFPEQITKNPPSPRMHALCYMGTVGPENGPDIAIKALARLRKRYPDATLDIVGGKEKDFAWLVPIIHALHLEDAVRHHGFVPRAAMMARILSTSSIGVAPYRATRGSPRWYGDAGKIRSYCGAGLAIVCSHVPPLGKEVAEKRAAIIVPDTPKDFEKACDRIFSDHQLYNTLRKNARLFARKNTWDRQFSQAFERMSALSVQ